MSKELIQSFDNLSIEMKKENNDTNSILKRKTDSDGGYNNKRICLNTNCKKDKEFFHCIHSAGWRETIVLEKKDTYSILDVMNIVDSLDKAWELGKKSKVNL